MKIAYATSPESTGMAPSKREEAKVAIRPRTAKMDKFMRQINGSPRFDIANIAVQVSQAIAKSKEVA